MNKQTFFFAPWMLSTSLGLIFHFQRRKTEGPSLSRLCRDYSLSHVSVPNQTSFQMQTRRHRSRSEAPLQGFLPNPPGNLPWLWGAPLLFVSNPSGQHLPRRLSLNWTPARHCRVRAGAVSPPQSHTHGDRASRRFHLHWQYFLSVHPGP